MKNNSRIHSAFSLIELSIVILIIGILIAGVTQSSRLVAKSRMSNAKTLTQSSPVASIKNISLWIETSSDGSFDDADTETSASVTNWYDINPQTSVKSSFVATTKPTYASNSAGNVNSLPTIAFNGTSQFMSATNFPNILNASTVIMVVRTPATVATGKAILSKRVAATGTNAGVNIEVQLGSTSTGWLYCDNSTSCFPASATVTASTPYIVSIVYNSSSSSTTALRFYQNGAASGTNGSTATSTVNTSVTDALYIGKQGLTSSPTFFGGNIGELIIFDRALKNEERQSIEGYLSKKWGIAVTVSS